MINCEETKNKKQNKTKFIFGATKLQQTNTDTHRLAETGTDTHSDYTHTATPTVTCMCVCALLFVLTVVAFVLFVRF